MAIQVGGTTVIDNSRVLSNVTGFDTATSNLIKAESAEINDYYDFTTTSLSPTISGGSSPYVAFQGTTTYPAGSYELSYGQGPNAPWCSATSSSRSKLPGPNDYFGIANAICAKVGSSYYVLDSVVSLATSASTDFMNTMHAAYFNNPANNKIVTMTSSFTLAMCFGTYDFSPKSTSSPTTSWGNRGSYKLNSGSSFGWVIRSVPTPSGPTSQDFNMTIDQEALAFLTSQERRIRDGLLKETDLWGLADYPSSQAQLDYRQALRDITDQAGFPENTTWPTKPE